MELLALGDNGWGDEMLRACVMTLAVSLCAIIFGLILAIPFVLMKLSNNKILKFTANFFTTVVRGIPELLIIYLFFFGSSAAIMFVASIFGHDGYIEINAFFIGAFCVGIICAAYSTEVLRGAVKAIPKGQIEASHAFGIRGKRLLFGIMIPQTLRIALPGIGNIWQLVLKDTALISVTGLVEIMRQTHVASGSTREPFLFLVTAGILYLLLTTFSNKLFIIAEKNYSKGFV
ncbi:ABC transporter permease subunit [Alphaproteobacteria bacterium]|nr:ABC transporter permease subunit [Alphaproteobacteria bacterium]